MDISYYKQYEPLWGSWHITREIGEGGCGKVFEIERKDEFSKTVYKSALKIITVPANATELESAQLDGLDEQSLNSYFYSMVQKFVREFELMFQLKGETNIVNYEDHSVIEHKDGVGWDILIKMELLTPTNDYFRINENLSCYNIVRLGIDMCKALEVCQSHKIIHRDIKPGNIFVNEKGDFKLGDFGVSRIKEETGSGLTKVGTTAYMAPEVYLGQKYNSSVDIYSLGLVLYRLLNYNRLPFLPSMPEAITYDDTENATDRRFKGEQFPNPANGDETLKKIVLKACAYNKKDRFHSPKEMREELEKLLPTASKESIAWVGSKNITTEPNTEEIPITDTITQTTEHPPEPKKRGVKEWLSKKKFLIDSTKGKNIWIGLAVIAVIVIIVDVALLYNRINKKENISENVNVSESQIYYSDFAAVYEQYRSDISAAARAYIETKTDKSILGIYCDDFNSNGTDEAFIITGVVNTVDSSYANCTIWYANSAACYEAATEEKILQYADEPGRIVEDENRKYFAYEKYDKDYGVLSEIFEVEDEYDFCNLLLIRPTNGFMYENGFLCGYSENEEGIKEITRFLYNDGTNNGFTPFYANDDEIKMAEIFVKNENVWYDENEDVYCEYTFIDLDGQAPLELMACGYSNYGEASIFRFYKADTDKETVEEIPYDSQLDGSYYLETICVYKDMYTDEIVYIMFNESNYCVFRMIDGRVYSYQTTAISDRFINLNDPSDKQFGGTCCYRVYTNNYEDSRYYLANAYSQFAYEGYGKLTAPIHNSMQSAYKKVLAEYFDFEDQGRSGYNLFDINRDGVYELVILAGTCEADYALYFYTYCENRLVYIGEMVSGHGALHSVNNGEKLYCISLHMFCEYVTEINISDYQVYGNTVFEAEHDPNTFTEYKYEDFEGYMEMQAFSDFLLLDNTQTFVEKADDVELTTEKETQKRGGLFSGLFG